MQWRFTVRWSWSRIALLGPIIRIEVRTTGLHLTAVSHGATRHETITLIVVHWTAGRIYRQLVYVNAHTIAMRILVSQQAGLQHLVRRGASARYQVAGGKRSLLGFSKVVLHVAVQFQLADLNQRVVLVRPYFRQVEGVQVILLRLGVRHHLDLNGPAREVTAIYGLNQVLLSTKGRLFGRFLSSYRLNALVGLEVPLHPVTLTLCIPQTQSMGAKAVHMTVRGRDTAIGHQDRHLMQGLRVICPELKGRCRVRQVGARVFLLRVDKVRELDRIIQEKYRRIVAYDVVIPLPGVELHSKTTGITCIIARILSAGHGRKPDKDVGLLTDHLQEVRNGEITQDLRQRKLPISTSTAGMHHALRNALAVKVGQFFEQVMVVKGKWSTLTGTDAVVVIGYGGARRSRQGCFAHGHS